MKPTRKPAFISEDNHKKIRKAAYKQNRSMSDILNEIIRLFFAVDKS